MSDNSSGKNKYYISDLTLFRRIKEYLKEIDHPENIDKDSMVEDFRLKYKEYSRRQKCAFRALAIRTYKIALETLNSEESEILKNSEVKDSENISSSGKDKDVENSSSGKDKDVENSSSGKDKDVENLSSGKDKDVENSSSGKDEDAIEKLSSSVKNKNADNADSSPEEKNSDIADDYDSSSKNNVDSINIDESSINMMEDRTFCDFNELEEREVHMLDDEGNDMSSDNEDQAGFTELSIITQKGKISNGSCGDTFILGMPKNVPYLKSLRKMVNSAPPKNEHITIISSDDDEEKEEEKCNFPPIRTKHGTVNIHRIDSSRGSKNFQAQNPLSKQKSLKRPYGDDEFPSSKKVKVKPSTISTIPNTSFKLFGGFSKILKTVSELVVHVKENDIYKSLGVKPPRGFLLHGPPGCGKTLLAQAIAGELEAPMIRVSGPELIGGVSGESESRIRDLFDSALEQAPCILFIDEIDAICPPRDTARREMERRIVAQLLTCIDGLGDTDGGDRVVIIGATNRPDALDPALRRAGRFDKEVCLGIPDRKARKEILEVITKDMKLKPGLDVESLSAATPGFVGADLKALASEAAIAAVNRCLEDEKKKFVNTQMSKSTSTKDLEAGLNGTKDEADSSSDSKSKEEIERQEEITYLSLLKSKGPLLSNEQLQNLYVEMDDFQKALKSVQPSAKREGFATVPDVTWEDIGSLKDVRDELEKSIMMPVKYPNEFAMLGINAPTGILLCGPPGCGKTLLAKAVANEANINFISVKGPELLNMYVGESERAVRQCFQRAKNSQPCVIFFDEIDALCPKRGATAEGTNATSRVVNQVLTEMDGVEGRAGVFLMAATNRPDMVDPAVLRPGRLDKILFVGLPTADDRADILRALTKNGTKPPMKNVNLDEIGKDIRLEGFTGADLAALIKESSLLSLIEHIKDKEKNPLFVTPEIIYQACAKIRPSVAPEERLQYETLRDLYGMPSIK